MEDAEERLHGRSQTREYGTFNKTNSLTRICANKSVFNDSHVNILSPTFD